MQAANIPTFTPSFIQSFRSPRQTCRSSRIAMKSFNSGEKQMKPLFGMSRKQRYENALVQLRWRERSLEEKLLKSTNRAARTDKTESNFDVVVVEALRNRVHQDERNETSTVFEMELHQVRNRTERALPTICEAEKVPLPSSSKSQPMVSSSPSAVHVDDKALESPVPLLRTPAVQLKSPLTTSTRSSFSQTQTDEGFTFFLSESESKEESINEKWGVDDYMNDEEENSILSTSTPSTTTISSGSSSFDRLKKKYSIDNAAVPKTSTHVKVKPFPRQFVSVIFDSADHASRTKRGSNCAGGVVYEIKEAAKDIRLAGQDLKATTAAMFSCGKGRHYEPFSPTTPATISSQSFFFN